MKDYPYVPGWRLNKENNKPAIKHSVLMLTTHGVAEGEWDGNEWVQYRWSCKVKDSDVLYWIHLEDLTQLEKEGDSLQQEQPEEICSKCIHHGKDDDYCYYPHGGMQSLINENGVYECTGFYEKEQEQSEPTCKTCGFYENNCPFIRGKFIPYPTKVCRDYTFSALEAEEKPVDLEKELIAWWDKHYSKEDYKFEKLNGHYLENNTLLEIARHFYELGRTCHEKEEGK